MKQLRTLLVAIFLSSIAGALAQPANDNFVNRITLSGLLVLTNGTTTAATLEGGEPSITGFADGNQTVWYDWTAPATVATTFRAGGNGYRALLGVYIGNAVGALSTIANVSAPNGGTNAAATFTATAGTSYKIKVDHRSGNIAGPFSLVVSQQVTGPLVNLTSPNNGQTVTNPASLSLSATVSTPLGGTVTNVSFYYQGSILIASFTTPPYNFTWNNPPVGTYQVTAQATDDQGRVGTSNTRTVTVRPSGYFSTQLIGFDTNNVWKYSTSEDLFGTGWETIGYDDSLWPEGPAGLGVDASSAQNGVPVRTPTAYAGNSAPQFFRRHFNLPFASTNGITLTLRELVEDAAVYYINGQEVRRSPLAPTDNPLTAASRTAGGQSQTDPTPIMGPYSFSISNVVPGDNVIAVVVIQSGAASTDIELAVELTAEGAGIAPALSIVTPTNNASYFAPASVTITANAVDSDGVVTNVDFFVDGVKIGQKTNSPYTLTWNTPTIGAHVARVVATDNDNASSSAQNTFVVYDAIGTPLVDITAPSNNTTSTAPANVALNATAYAPAGVTNVEFYANSGGGGLGAKVGQSISSPYNIVWNNALAGNYVLRAVVSAGNGARATSAPVNLTLTNTPPPVVLSKNPAPGTVPAITSVQVTFSKDVTGVNASDFLVNGVAATSVTPNSASVYTFDFTQPNFGQVNITWASAHGIQDLSGQPFNTNTTGANWSYTLADNIAPTITARIPASGANVTNLTTINVNFSENVAGVGAADLLINGSPASGMTANSGSNYTFSFAQPAPGTVSISWIAGHGIADTSPLANAFDQNGAGATWSYTLTVPPTVLIPSNTMWRFVKGINAVTDPGTAWRQIVFDDSTWPDGTWADSPTPFYYGDPYTNVTTGVGTLLSDMQNNYQCILLRHTFVINSPSSVSNFTYRHQIDDGFVAWINGTEALRVNMNGAPTDPPYVLASGVGNANEPNNTGAAYITATSTLGLNALVPGTNVLTVQAFNGNISSSSDFGFNLQFEGTIVDSHPSNTPPRVLTFSPSSGDVFSLSNLVVTFNEPVTGVNAADLLVNGVPATGLTSLGGSNYTFTFSQPNYGSVNVTWAGSHGIVDFDAPPKAFDANAGGSTVSYTLINASAPTIVSQTPLASSTINNLTQLQVSFSEAVQGVNASDLLINGSPATGFSGSGANYTFTFPQPAYGNVAISWAVGHNIRDVEPAQNAFDPSRPGATWSYNLIDQTAPTILIQNPLAGANVTNLTSITVTFSESVLNVNAADLLINGIPATGLTGGGATYTFTFAQPSTSIVNVNWANNHGITDTSANSFNSSAPGATWQYLTPDNVPPTVDSTVPPAGSTVRSLTQIAITFEEPVTGVNASDLRINGTPAQTVSGSGAGPYTFGFTQPSTGVVDVVWAAGHGITDLANPPNAFAGGEFSYVLNPNAVFTDKIVINEIYFHPSTEQTNQEWFELYNTDTAPVNVTGWRVTRGVDFTFPNVSIPAGGYLVVAASVSAFQSKYPGVLNVVGGWAGQLGNTDDDIEIETATGERVDLVHYADEGDWAIRQRGIQDVANANPLLNRGWAWFSGADGTNINTATGQLEGGRSLELRNPLMPNQYGQNWGFSTQSNGTPGVANTLRTTNVAPLVVDVAHFPPVPTSADPVTINARIIDEQTNGVAVTLFYRNHTTTSPLGFTSSAMFDDGMHNDGLANDGVFGFIIATQAVGTVTEFYVQAVDSGLRTNTWPRPARQLDGSFQQTANALFQVDNEAFTTNQPFFRIILTGSESSEYYNQLNQNSDAEMNATLITMDGEGTKVRYEAGMRIRGAGSRSGTPKNNRVNVPSDRRWNGLAELNLNNRYTHIQTLGSAVAHKSGLPAAYARPIQYRINGAQPNGTSAGLPQLGSFVLVEPINGDWAKRHYPNDANGNGYRASTGNHNADFTNFGTNANSYVTRGYSKTSNQSENDWSDMNRLTLALNSAAADNIYLQGIRTNLNVTNWMRYFAVCILMEYSETAICVGRGDDYAMYRGIIDPRFTMVPHDFDTVFGEGDTAGNISESIWIMLNPPNTQAIVPVLNRFMRHPEFVPIYFGELKRLADTVFAPTNFNPLADQMLADWPGNARLPSIKSFNASRVANVLSQIPLTYSLVHTLGTSNGVLRSTTPTISLRGTANAIDTRVVRVNGSASTYSAWEGRWTNNAVALQPGLNNLLVEAVDANNATVWSANLTVWYDPGTFTSVSGNLAGNTIWSPGAGPYRVTGNITIPSGATLTIQPGTTVYFDAGQGISVASGGRILADGNANARINFNIVPGPSNRWGGITINGAVGSPDSRISYAHIEGNNNQAINLAGGSAVLDHLTFGTTDRRYLNLDAASFVVSYCNFPNATALFEMIHGTGGIKAGGRGIFLRNYFGKALSTSGNYNDVLDFTGGNRPGPIVQFIENVFVGSDDDLLDLDGTDAWVEGNIFMHAHRNGSPDSASAVSGGNDSGQTSEITIIGNIFYDVDQAATAKQGNFYTFINNTVVHQSGAGYADSNVTAVLNFADEGIAQALGMYVEGNIIYDAERLVRDLTNGTTVASNTVFNNNLMPFTWAGAGTNNSAANPLLKRIPQLSETTNFTTWEQAQVLREWFTLQAGSPGIGSGPNGRDKGGVVPIGASISGDFGGTNPVNTATLRVGVVRSGNGIPSAAATFPNGSGYTHYKWRLDEGAWSAETVGTAPINVSGLGLGAHRVDVVGKRDAGLYQDDTNYAPANSITESRTWYVNTNNSVVRFNEALASNGGVFVHSNTTPDAIELYNASASPVDLEGMRITDDPNDPDKFIFGPGVIIPAGGYLVVFADNNNTPGVHLEFTLSAEGETLYLYNSVARGGALLDTLSFGLQLNNYSVGRLADGSWNLCQPTLGSANVAAAIGDPLRLRINEWLAAELVLSDNDFIELFNADALPVALGGLYLTDEPIGWPGQHQISALSFIAGGGYRSFTADGDVDQGAEHLNFSLTPEQGMIGLMNRDLSVIDCVVYGAQRVDISQGRSPNGSSNIIYFVQPTPGAPNPSVINTNTGIVINEILANNGSYVEADGTTPDWVEFHNRSAGPIDMGDMSFSDSSLLPRRYVFAPGTIVPSLGYLRLRCDADLPASATNAGFGLKASGGSVFLFDKLANGGSPLDSTNFGLQAVDFSIARIPNGTGPFVLTVPTPDANNGVSGAALGNVNLLKINEWMAAPSSGDDWFEIYNPSVQPVSIGGLYLSDSLANRVKSPIPNLSFMGGGTNGWQRFWADSNPGAGADHANFGLAAGGEALVLSFNASTSIDSNTFGAQQTGVSEGRFPDGAAAIGGGNGPGGWTRFPGTASPGDANYLLLTNIVINEALTHTDLPFEDAIELRNLTGSPTNIGNWWLSDAKGVLKKYRIPANTTIPANGYVVFYEYQFNSDPTNDPQHSFSLSSGKGDQIYLSAADTNGNLTGYRATVDFGPAENGVSFGRYVTSDNRQEFVAMSARSFGNNDPSSVAQFRTNTGAVNPYPKVGPVVIAQIMYRPPDIGTNDNSLDEFIELRNISAQSVPLYHPVNTSNTWRLRDAVDFNFPQGVSLTAGSRLLLVSFDPAVDTAQLAAFRSKYAVDAGVPIYGPYSGKLANNDDKVELYKPDSPNITPTGEDVPYILADRVHYFDAAPWTPSPDGTGAALLRVSLTGFGNDPTNWVASVPNFGGGTDTDGDGMPDAWELQYGLNPTNAADANLDLDLDGMTNLSEYLAGTDPTSGNPNNPFSTLRILSVENLGANNVRLSFIAVSNKTYSVQGKNALTELNWGPVVNVSAAPTNRLMFINTTVPLTNRFFRLRTPQAP